MASLIARARLRRRGSRAARPSSCATRAYEEISAELPEEDLREDLSESLDLYVMGSKPRCEEVEYLDLVHDAMDQIGHED
ncbi:hypothetical protein LHJ74_20685 [Streptomyces sp. N2-109]|uniref:Uncharacterized protein n=1 Tax=Streptomyces gossypii TaxID=2883101 RepID=A0ABT2JWL2_9ACTN|nr:hypothetical protein [Streptomyces gossypii]MCT2592289.1 hypothetical protein [Streptomyces gossypii]